MSNPERSNPERRSTTKSNKMTAFTKTSLEQALKQAKSEFSDSQLAIGEAAGRESDWHDNAAFDYANMVHYLKSANLINLIRKLHYVEIIKPRRKIDFVDIGNMVVIKFLSEPKEETFTILGPDDSGRKPGWLSYLSPLGKNLIGKRKGDIAEYYLEGNKEKQTAQIIEILPGNFEE